MQKNNVMMVVNPISGGVDKWDLIEEVKHYAENLNLNFYCFETTGVNDLQNIKDYYAKYQPDRVLIAGGDGTIKLVAEALENEDVLFGILPVGSANGLATDLGLIKSQEENIAIAFQDYFVVIDFIRINNKMCLHLSDIGLNADLIKNYEKSPLRGKLGYALQIFKTVSRLRKSFQVHIKTSDQLIETKAQMIVIANSQKYGTGVMINPIGIMGDGKFELIVLKKLSLSVFWKIIRGQITVSSKDITVISTEKAMIQINKPISFQIDGEFYGKESNLDVQIKTRKLKVAMLKV